MNLLMIVGLVAVGIVVVIAAMGILISGDIMSNTATGSETLGQVGTPAGKALVVYDPGVSGAAKNAASKIAGDLQSKGYTVDLAGIKSATAGNLSGYDVIAVGGPTYGGNTSSSITAYLKTLTPAKNATVGIFATGGVTFNNTIPWYEQDRVSITEEVTEIWSDRSLSNAFAIKVIRGDEADKDCAGFVSDLLQ